MSSPATPSREPIFEPSPADHRVCPLCGADNRARTASRWSRGEWTVKVCGDCGFPYLENAPSCERLKDEFAWEKTSEEVTAARRAAAPARAAASRQVKKLKRRLLKRRKVLDLLVGSVVDAELSGHVVDVGCGTGSGVRKVAAELRERGLEITPVGIEISAELAVAAQEKCRQLEGRCLHADALSGLENLAENSTAGVIMSSYLEHEVRPREVLAAALRVMKPAACCVVKVPNYDSINRRVAGTDWCGFRYPDHVNYFTPSSLRKMAEDCGFEIARQTLFDRFPTSDNMYAVLRKPA
ncbi:MAG: class I SAM-dependent methyltransferase [Verrucomicrobiales bacterium]